MPQPLLYFNISVLFTSGSSIFTSGLTDDDGDLEATAALCTRSEANTLMWIKLSPACMGLRLHGKPEMRCAKTSVNSCSLLYLPFLRTLYVVPSSTMRVPLDLYSAKYVFR